MSAAAGPSCRPPAATPAATPAAQDSPLLRRHGAAWRPVPTGESGDRVYRREDGAAFAKLAGAGREAALAGERDRLLWLADHDVPAPRLLAWEDEPGTGACFVMSAVPGIPASALPSPELRSAWPPIARALSALHRLPAGDCPFDRGLAAMHARARDVVARGAVNPDFLADEDRALAPAALLARLDAELPARLAQEQGDRVVCHGDPCLPNIMIDPTAGFRCTGFVDLGRLGTADRYADVALLLANAADHWASATDGERAAALLFDVLGLGLPDRDRLAFYLRLDPLTWG